MPRPLEGIRVVDVSQLGVGPWAAMILSLAGAEVIKVEPPWGDPMLAIYPRHQNVNSLYLGANSNKKSVILDLASASGQAALLRLVEASDVFVANFRPIGLETLHITYAELSRVNPRLVYCNSSSYGSHGPRCDSGSQDFWAQAFGGILSLNGEPDGPPELDRSAAVADVAGAMVFVQAILGGIAARELTGVGQEVGSSQLAACLALVTTRAAEFLYGGAVPVRMGSESPWAVPSASFETADGYIAVSAETDEQWQALCAALGLHDLADRYPAAKERVSARGEINLAIQGALKDRPTLELEAFLQAAGVPASHFASRAEYVECATAPGRGLTTTLDHPRGQLTFPLPGWRFDGWEPALSPGPSLPGQHSREIIDAFSLDVDEIPWQDPEAVGP